MNSATSSAGPGYEIWVRQIRKYANLLEQKLDEYGKPFQHVMPHLGRFLLVSTFIEDGVRMYVQWPYQVTYLVRFRGFSAFIAKCFLFYNIVAQLGGSSLILARKFVPHSVAALFAVIAVT